MEREQTDQSQISKDSVKEHLSKRLTRETLHELYYVQNKSLQDIADEYKCTRQNIYHIMKQHRMPRRKRSQARVLAIKQNKFENFEYDDINENFFSVWSPETAWVLGLLYTDGCLHEGKTNWRVTFESIDLELINKVKTLMNSTRRSYKRTQSYDKSKHIYVHQISREKMINDLKNIGITQRKSLTMRFPDVPENCMRHFIRGCWDGDGSVYISGAKLRVSYTCGSYAFIERLAHELYKVGIYKAHINYTIKYAERESLRALYPDGKYPITIHKKVGGNSYDIKFGDSDQLEKFYHYLYDGVGEHMYLSRKYIKFVEGLRL